MKGFIPRRRLIALSAACAAFGRMDARAEDKLLNEIVGFNGAMLFMDARVPALIIGAVRKGETAVFGFGETSAGSGKTPDGQTMLRIGSITKAFTGQVLAGLVAQGAVRLTDRLQDRLGWPVKVPERDGRPIRLIELATHTSGLPREVDRTSGPADDPFRTLTQEAYIKGLQSDPLLFTPGARWALFQLRLRPARCRTGSSRRQALRAASQANRLRSGRAEGHGPGVA